MRIIDWSSDVCSSDLLNVLQQIFAIRLALGIPIRRPRRRDAKAEAVRIDFMTHALFSLSDAEAYWPSETLIVMWLVGLRSEEHTSELQSLMRISYAVFCLKKKNINL